MPRLPHTLFSAALRGSTPIMQRLWYQGWVLDSCHDNKTMFKPSSVSIFPLENLGATRIVSVQKNGENSINKKKGFFFQACRQMTSSVVSTHFHIPTCLLVCLTFGRSFCTRSCSKTFDEGNLGIRAPSSNKTFTCHRPPHLPQ